MLDDKIVRYDKIILKTDSDTGQLHLVGPTSKAKKMALSDQTKFVLTTRK